jgi:hypothetical protein
VLVKLCPPPIAPLFDQGKRGALHHRTQYWRLTPLSKSRRVPSLTNQANTNNTNITQSSAPPQCASRNFTMAKGWINPDTASKHWSIVQSSINWLSMSEWGGKVLIYFLVQVPCQCWVLSFTFSPEFYNRVGIPTMEFGNWEKTVSIIFLWPTTIVRRYTNFHGPSDGQQSLGRKEVWTHPTNLPADLCLMIRRGQFLDEPTGLPSQRASVLLSVIETKNRWS